MVEEGSLIYQICPDCKGSGVDIKWVASGDMGGGGLQEVDCPICGGVKYILWGYVTKDDFEIPDDLPEH